MTLNFSLLQTWSKLMHPNILRKPTIPTYAFTVPIQTQWVEFLGANILDDKPFIVMPYIKNGNVRDYIKVHPDCNRVKIVCNSCCS